MISYQAVLLQLEKQLADARNTTNEQQIRERLTAIRALCDVVLDFTVEVPKAQPKHLPQLLATETTPTSLYTAKIEEDDGANGDSIFDF
ncbi:uracil-DNA glycosylase [Lysinibacillus fusiformis]|nr:uracil-DNA glycosylase [Lysinibacillus fusiformis]